jgi:tRNA (mo5U34)-methyltransferase
MLDRPSILESIKKLEPWWHCIDLGDGIQTKTNSLMGEQINHPIDRWEVIGRCVPADLTGKSVLDIGCNAGFFSIEAKRRNAARVLGIDAQRHEIMQAQFVKRVLGLDIEYQQMNIYDVSPATVGTFDVTLALGLLYHCKHLLLAIETLFAVTNELLIVDSSVLPQDDAANSVSFGWGSLQEKVQLLGYVEQSSKPRNENHANWFFTTGECLKAMLLDVGFHKVDVALNEGRRAVLTCHKNLELLNSRTPRGLNARIAVVSGPAVCAPGEELVFQVRVENIGFATWLARRDDSDDRGFVWLGAHVSSETFDVEWNYAGADLPRDLKPQESVTVQLTARAPGKRGKHHIEFDMVSEKVTWFQDAGSRSAVHELEVQ